MSIVTRDFAIRRVEPGRVLHYILGTAEQIAGMCLPGDTVHNLRNLQFSNTAELHCAIEAQRDTGKFTAV